MKRIYKYPFHVMDEQSISMPAGAEILTVQYQRNSPCLWAKVDDEAELKPRWIFVRGTGKELTGAEGRFIGTFQFPPFVWHVFEGK